MKQKVMIALLCAAPLLAQAQFAKPDDAVEYRQSVFTVMGMHFARIGAVVKGERPFNKEEVAQNAELVATLSQLPWPAFENAVTNAHSKAKPAVWQDNAKFKEDAGKLQKAAAQLAVVAKGGDLASIKKAFGETAQSCKSCHDSFRAK